jgi:hypothetical protein
MTMKINIPEKITKTLYVTVYTAGYSAGDICVNDFNATEFDSAKANGTVLICTKEVEFQLPSNFDVTEPLVAMLEKSRESVVKEFSLQLKAIDQQLAEARALPAPEADPWDQGPFHDWTPPAADDISLAGGM